ncbi:hypothetical protein BGZ72_007998, partial [Mortierella alpina]
MLKVTATVTAMAMATAVEMAMDMATVMELAQDKVAGSVNVVACSKYSRLTAALLAKHTWFIQKLQPGLYFTTALPALEPADRAFLNPMVVYTESTRPTQARVAGAPPVLTTMHLDNCVVFYQRRHFTDFAGMRGIVLDPLPQRQAEVAPQPHVPTPQWRNNLVLCWDTLRAINPLVKGYLAFHSHNAVPPLPQAITTNALTMNQSAHMSPGQIAYAMPAGPMAAAAAPPLATTVVGIKSGQRKSSPIKNKYLLGILFLWLFPFGVGYFSLEMAKKIFGSLGQTNPSSRSRSTPKHLEFHGQALCRRQAISSVPLRLAPQRAHIGFAKHTTSSSRAGRPTQVQDIL